MPFSDSQRIVGSQPQRPAPPDSCSSTTAVEPVAGRRGVDADAVSRLQEVGRRGQPRRAAGASRATVRRHSPSFCGRPAAARERRAPRRPVPGTSRATWYQRYRAAVILVVAATEFEAALVDGAPVRTVVCGIGPVEAALATSRAIADERADRDPADRHRRRADAAARIARARVGSRLLRRHRPARARSRASSASQPDAELLASGTTGAARRARAPDRHDRPRRRRRGVRGRGDGGIRRPARGSARRCAGARAPRGLEPRRRSGPRPAGASTTRSTRFASRCRRSSRSSLVRDLPPPLPPETRTVGQLVAETIRAYGNDFWRVLPLGLPLAIADQLSVRQHVPVQMIVFWAMLPLFVAALPLGVPGACSAHARRVTAAARRDARSGCRSRRSGAVVSSSRRSRGSRSSASPCRRRWSSGSASATLSSAVAGSARPTTCTRSARSPRSSSSSGSRPTRSSALLHTQGDNGQRVAVFLSDLVLSPLLFVGGALLYVDQAARAVRSAPDAALHPPVDADAAGRTDPQVES